MGLTSFQKTLLGLLAFLGLIVFASALILHFRNQDLNTRIEEDKAVQASLLRSAQKYPGFFRKPGATETNESPRMQVLRIGRDFGISSAIRTATERTRQEKNGERTWVQVQMDMVPHLALMEWMNALEEAGLTVTEIRLTPSKAGEQNYDTASIQVMK